MEVARFLRFWAVLVDVMKSRVYGWSVLGQLQADRILAHTPVAMMPSADK